MPVHPVQLEGSRILITGPTGKVAESIVARLAPVSDVHALARFSKAEHRERIEHLGARTVQAALDDPDRQAG